MDTANSPTNSLPGNDLEPKIHDVGVLLVHGIGEQTPGKTLLAFGEPIYNWVQAWVENIPSTEMSGRQHSFNELIITKFSDGKVNLTHAQLDPNESLEPAHVELGFQVTKQTIAQDLSSSWLLAESNWANSFTPPRFFEVVGWFMKVIPWVIGSYVVRKMGLGWSISNNSSTLSGRVLSWLSCGLMFIAVGMVVGVVSLPIILIIEVILLLLAFLSLIPIPSLQSYLQWVQRAISSIIGDSFMFTESPFRREAIAQRVCRDLAWLRKRCSKVVIIAHSQGAAVVYLALKNRIPSQLQVLITVGSGLLKLHQLSSITTKLHANVLLLFVLGAGLIGTFILAEWFGLTPYSPQFVMSREEHVLQLMVPMFTMLVICVGWLINEKGTMKEDSRELKTWAKNLKAKGVFWQDYFALSDPIPNGPLFISSGDEPVSELLSSTPIHNEDSIVSDHTTYFDNSEDFISGVVSTISRQTDSLIPLHELTSVDQIAIKRSREGRHRRVQFKKLHRWALLGGILALIGNLEFLNGAGIVIQNLLEKIINLVGSFETDGIREYYLFSLSNAHWGVISVVVCYLGLSQLGKFFWSEIDKHEQDLLFNRHLRQNGMRKINKPRFFIDQPYLYCIHIIPISVLTFVFHYYFPYTIEALKAFGMYSYTGLVTQGTIVAVALTGGLFIFEAVWIVKKDLQYRKVVDELYHKNSNVEQT